VTYGPESRRKASTETGKEEAKRTLNTQEFALERHILCPSLFFQVLHLIGYYVPL
jgi:hypothetical protein